MFTQNALLLFVCRDATGMVLHKDSKWYQQWQEFKDNNPVVTGKTWNSFLNKPKLMMLFKPYSWACLNIRSFGGGIQEDWGKTTHFWLLSLEKSDIQATYSCFASFLLFVSLILKILFVKWSIDHFTVVARKLLGLRIEARLPVALFWYTNPCAFLMLM